MRKKRVVVTGLGAVSPLGVGMQKTWNNLLLGVSGIQRIESFDPITARLDVHIAGEVKNFDPSKYFDKKVARRLDRATQFGIVAAQEAVATAHLASNEACAENIGVIFGTGIGGFATTLEQYEIFRTKGTHRVSPLTIPMLMPNAVAANIASTLQFFGPCYTPTSACASGADAIGIALDLIRNDKARACVAGATEAAILPFCLAAFQNMGALTIDHNATPEKASRPFDRDRKGFVLSEGSAALVLEDEDFARERKADILAELAGYGSATDGYHITAPHPEGNGAIRATREALKDAQLSPWAISYINAHGTSTALNDAIETKVIRSVYGEYADKILVSGTKSMTGHLLGAAGALEAAFCVLSIATGLIPATINLENVDPDCMLNHVRTTTIQKKYAAVSNSFGFGGHNSVLIFKPYSR